MRRLTYGWKALFNWAWVLLAVGQALFWLLLLSDGLRSPYPAPRMPEDLVIILDLYLPLAVAIMLAAVPVAERESGVAELHLTYRQRAWVRQLGLMAVPVGLWAGMLGLTLVVGDRLYVTLPLVDLLAGAIPPAMALGAAALVGSALARHQVGGVLVAGLWWAIDLTAPGQINRWAYLFSRFQPLPELEPTLVQGHLWLVAAGCLALTLWLAERRARWVTA